MGGREGGERVVKEGEREGSGGEGRGDVRCGGGHFLLSSSFFEEVFWRFRRLR